MKQLTNLGTQTKTFDRLDYIDLENDSYPVPLFSKPRIIKATGFDRLVYPMMYFQINKVRQVLDEYENEELLFEQDYYRRNVIGLICLSNFPTNISYSNNVALYEKLFFCVLENISGKNLSRLFDDLLINDVMWGVKQFAELLNQVSDREHLLIALWNYGLKYSESDIEKIPKKLQRIFKSGLGNFNHKKRYKLLNQVCPITLEPITDLAILTDGYVYEYEMIRKHLLDKNTSPMTNEELSCKSRSVSNVRSDGTWYNVTVSAKVLYLPEKNQFVHFELA